MEETAGHDRFRTCLRLKPPEVSNESYPEDQAGEWTVTFHLQAAHDPTVVLDAQYVWGGGAGLTLLRRQYDVLREQLEADLRRASHLFEPLAKLIDRDPHPVCCRLDPEAAYAFLREAAPLLELNGFAVVLPQWWTSQRPQLGLRLRLDPVQPGPGQTHGLGLDALVDYKWQVALGDEL